VSEVGQYHNVEVPLELDCNIYFTAIADEKEDKIF
jgi:hypothetical protein